MGGHLSLTVGSLRLHLAPVVSQVNTQTVLCLNYTHLSGVMSPLSRPWTRMVVGPSWGQDYYLQDALSLVDYLLREWFWVFCLFGFSQGLAMHKG